MAEAPQVGRAWPGTQTPPPAQTGEGERPEFAELWSPKESDRVPRGPAAILLERGAITPAQLEAARNRQREVPHMSVLGALVEAEAADQTTVARAVAEYFNIPFLSVAPADIDQKTFSLLDAGFIGRKCVLPIRREDEKVLVGVSDPADIFLLDEVKRRIRRPIRLVLTPAADILRAVEELGRTSVGDVNDIIQGITEDDVELVATSHEEVTDLEKMAGESPVIRYVNYLVFSAVQEGASDIHIEPGEETLRIRYRIDGVLFEQSAPPWKMRAAIISRLKIMSNMDIAERRLPQDGRVRAMVHGRHVDLRVSTLPTTHGEKGVIRILDNRSIMIGLEALGMQPDTLESFRGCIAQPHGIVLVTGPTGSGKTTTLYSALQVMDGKTQNISTVEDPVEYQLDFANQVNVQEGIGLTFAASLRSLLRQDPDVIMVGEIRDEETARIAVQASLTGHMVLSTLHTNDAPSSITRLINIGVEPFLIAASVEGVLAQRLVRRICDHCKQAVTDLRDDVAAHLREHNVDAARLYHGAGCDRCRQTGYAGRMGVYEMVDLDDDLREMIAGNPPLMEIRRRCRRKGMRSLREDGFQKVAAGLTTVEEVVRATETQGGSGG